MIWSQFCVGHSNRLNLKRRRCRWYGGYLPRSSGNSYKWYTFLEWSPCGCRIRQMVSAYQMIDEAILWQFKSSVKWLLGRVVLGKNYILSLALLSLYPMCGNGPLDYLFMFTISIPEAYNGLCRIWFEPKGHQIVGWVLCICGPPTTLIDWGRWINASHFNLGADSPLSVWVWWAVYPE